MPRHPTHDERIPDRQVAAEARRSERVRLSAAVRGVLAALAWSVLSFLIYEVFQLADATNQEVGRGSTWRTGWVPVLLSLSVSALVMSAVALTIAIPRRRRA